MTFIQVDHEEELNIVADVAGQWSALKRLHAKMPSAKTLGVGDLVDRGPDSRQVIEWFMEDSSSRDSLKGNHEDILLSVYFGDRKYPGGCWGWNGGTATMKSYGADGYFDFIKKVPKEHIAWLHNRPLYYEGKDLLVTHAPISARLDNWKDALIDDRQFECGTYILWNRSAPRIRDKFQVFGHNASETIEWFRGTERGHRLDASPREVVNTPVAPDDAWGICLDASRADVLTGMHWPSMTIYQEPYGD